MRGPFTTLALYGSLLWGVGASEQSDLDLVLSRRKVDLAMFPDNSWFAKIPTWLQTQKSDGTWPDVNYLSGCPAQRANWPIQEHWNRMITFAAAWSGENPSSPSNWTNNADVMAGISKGLDYWFENDYKASQCMGDGGNAAGNCPCGTPGLWNTNWYDQAILIPQLCSTTCLLLSNATLSDSQVAGCSLVPRRAYDLIDGVYTLAGLRMTGANAVLVAQNTISLALYTANATMLKDAYNRAMSVMTFADQPIEDGIHRDGTFLQHTGILYNGNYGKDLFNAFIQIGGEAIGTAFAAPQNTKDAIAAQVRGNEWMIIIDEKDRREHWDFNAVGRFVAFPSQDLQANSDINFNTTKLKKATSDFTGAEDVSDTVRRLLSNGTEKLTGNKGFWASDYMVHRRKSFVLANKMLSTRSLNTETVNGANPYANHFGQGSMFTYVDGTEYRDIMGAWDWNLVPGTTTLLNLPVLSSNNTNLAGKKSFVGVVSDGQAGTAVMDYVDPANGALSYRKAWFFIDDYVLVSTINIKKDGTNAPVINVLDNRASTGDAAYVDGRRASGSVSGKTLFYGRNGYLSHDKFSLTLSDGKRTGNWSAISTSTVGETTVSIFSAYDTVSKDSSSYTVFPATNRVRLALEAKFPTTKPITQNGVSGAVGNGLLSVVFWPGGASSTTVQLRDIGWAATGSLTITAQQPGAYLLSASSQWGRPKTVTVTVSDPTQNLTSTSVSFKVSGKWPTGWFGPSNGGESKLSFELPTGGMAGSSVSKTTDIKLPYW